MTSWQNLAGCFDFCSYIRETETNGASEPEVRYFAQLGLLIDRPHRNAERFRDFTVTNQVFFFGHDMAKESKISIPKIPKFSPSDWLICTPFDRASHRKKSQKTRISAQAGTKSLQVERIAAVSIFNGETRPTADSEISPKN